MTINYEGNDTYTLDFYTHKIVLGCDEIKTIKSYNFYDNKIGKSVEDLEEELSDALCLIEDMKNAFREIKKLSEKEIEHEVS